MDDLEERVSELEEEIEKIKERNKRAEKDKPGRSAGGDEPRSQS